MKMRIAALALVVFLIVPLTTLALTQQEKNTLLLQLIQKILELNQKLVALGGTPIQLPPGLASLTQQPQQGSTCTLSRTLSLGMRGDDVSCLQTFLIQQNLLAPENATGYFGRLTQAAVASLQRSRGLEPVGSVGRLTRAIVNTAPPAAPPVTTPPPAGGGSTTPPPVGGGGGGGGGGGTPPPPPPQPPLPGDAATAVRLTQSIATTTSAGATAQSVTIAWDSSGASSCTVKHMLPDGTIDTFTGSGTSGSTTTAPVELGVHRWTADCTGEGGASAHAGIFHGVTVVGVDDPSVRLSFTKNLYTCIVGRAPGSKEVLYWSTRPVGTSQQSIFQAFFGSAEYVAKQTSNDTYLRQIWQCVFGMQVAPDTYWTSVLNAGVSRDYVLYSFLASPAYQTGVGKTLAAQTGFSISVAMPRRPIATASLTKTQIMDTMKNHGCVWDGLLNDTASTTAADIALLNRSQCKYAWRALESWQWPPDFTQALMTLGKITKTDIVYGMNIAEDLPTNVKYWYPDEVRYFDFPSMCRTGSVGFWGPHTCKPTLESPEYRKYLTYIMKRAVDTGVQEFLIGQVYYIDTVSATKLPPVIADVRAYAQQQNKQIIVGAQTNDITDAAYLAQFDYIEGGVGQDAQGNIEEGPCASKMSSNSFCWGLLWNPRYASHAQNVVIALDWTGLAIDDTNMFSHMSTAQRAAFLLKARDYFRAKGVGFLMPFRVPIMQGGGGCHGASLRYYTPDDEYGCPDEAAVNALLR